MPAVFTTLSQRAISDLMRSANSLGLLATGTKPSVSSFFLVTGSAAILTISAFHLSTIALGVPAGATMPVSVSLSSPGTPSSILVGRSGRAATRALARTAIPRRLPSLILPIAGGKAVNAIGVVAVHGGIDGERRSVERH